MGDMADYYDERMDPEPNPGYLRATRPVSAKGRMKVQRKQPSIADARRAAEEGIAKLQQFIAELDEDEAKLPEEPPVGTALSVLVRFKSPGKRASNTYEFLILRTAGGYYTTGTSNSYFPTWEQLLGWLRSDRVVWHSEMRHLKVNDSIPPVMKASDA